MVEDDLDGEGKQVLVGICAMAKKSQSKPMKEILTRLEEFEYIKVIVFGEEVILKVININQIMRSGKYLKLDKVNNYFFFVPGTG